MDIEAMRYTHDPAETVELIYDGADFSDYTTDELLAVVYSLLEAERVDLAMPLYTRIYEGVESLLDTLMRYYARCGELPPAGDGDVTA